MHYLREKMEGIEQLRVYLPPVDEGKLKKFAALVMLIDHFAYAFLERVRTPEGRPLMFSLQGGFLLDRILRAVGRQAFPIFCFFLVEGFFYTSSRWKYFARLFLFAVLSQIPFQFCLFPQADVLHLNVIGTLCLGYLAIWCLEELGKAFTRQAGKGGEELQAGARAPGWSLRGLSPVYALLLLIAFGGTVTGFGRLAQALRSDYSYGGVGLIVILYLLREYRFAALFISWVWMSWYNGFEVYAAPAFFLLACYNGKRGKQSKYFFYFFYPAHLLVLWLVRRYLYGY